MPPPPPILVWNITIYLCWLNELCHLQCIDIRNHLFLWLKSVSYLQQIGFLVGELLFSSLLRLYVNKCMSVNDKNDFLLRTIFFRLGRIFSSFFVVSFLSVYFYPGISSWINISFRFNLSSILVNKLLVSGYNILNF